MQTPRSYGRNSGNATSRTDLSASLSKMSLQSPTETPLPAVPRLSSTPLPPVPGEELLNTSRAESQPPLTSRREDPLLTSRRQSSQQPLTSRRESSSRLSTTNIHERHEAWRQRKQAEVNAQAIENRIRFFKREEEKVWRDLEDVRRQAAQVEEGRVRVVEKKLADRAIKHEKEVAVREKKAKAVVAKAENIEVLRKMQIEIQQKKAVAGVEQRKVSADIMRQKRMMDAQVRLANSEKAIANQRVQLEARLRINQEKAIRLERLKERQDAERIVAQDSVIVAESRIPQLEAEEMACLQRLQNSRIVTQSVLEELETTLGSSSSVTALLRQKQRGGQRDHPDMTTSFVEGDSCAPTPRRSFAQLPTPRAGSLAPPAVLAG